MLINWIDNWIYNWYISMSEVDNIPEQFIADIYCDLGFMPLPSQLEYLYEIQKVIDSNNYDYNYIDLVKRKSRYLKDIYYYKRVLS